MAGRTSLFWGWNSDDAIGHNGKLWWVNLPRGILSCNPFMDHPMLQLDDLPETFPDELKFNSSREIEADRCVRLSRDKLRYVELTRASWQPEEATVIVMWTLVTDPVDGFSWWQRRYESTLGMIWKSESYESNKLPMVVLLLGAISPSNPDIILFLLKDNTCTFSVNVPECRVLNHTVQSCGPMQLVHAGVLRQPLLSWRYLVAWELPPLLSSRGQHGRVPLNLRSETLQLRRSEYALKLLREDSLKRLEEGLLLCDVKKKEDSSWNRTQIVLLAVLVTGLTGLFSFWPWLPLAVYRPLLMIFSAVWVVACLALPLALFGAGRCQIGFGRHAARGALMCFSVFVVYGLYCMAVGPAPGSDHGSAPAPHEQTDKEWGWTEFFYGALGALSFIGHTASWIWDCYRGHADEQDVH